MADKKISQMALLSAVDLNPAVDYLPIVDPSEPAAADQNKRILAASIVVNAALGTPVSGTLTNCTGLPIVAGTTGTLSVARGGTGLTSYTAGSVVYSEDGTSLTSGIKFGTAPQDIVLNQFLSGMAYQDPNNVTIGGGSATLTSLTATTVTGTSMVYNGTELNARLNPLAQAVSVQMTASTTVGGIQQLDNVNNNFATGDFSISVRDRVVAGPHVLFVKRGATNSDRTRLLVNSAGALDFIATVGGVDVISVSFAGASAFYNQSAEYAVSVTRETATAAGSATLYINGVQVAAAVISAATPASLSLAVQAYYGSENSASGWNSTRARSDFYSACLFNRALTAAEVLDLSINGVALADRGASQVNQVQNGTFDTDSVWTKQAAWTIGSGVASYDGSATQAIFQSVPTGVITPGSRLKITGNISNVSGDGIASFTFKNSSFGTIFNNSEDDVSQAAGAFELTATVISASVNLAIYGVPSNSFDLDDIVVQKIGLTSELLASNAQSDTGQIFDTSGNKNHALLPASGATVVGRPVSQTREVRWTNTWDGTNELQYIGGVNQAILPANAYIESIIGTVSGATPHDIIIGDGSDTDRYVTITTGLAAGTTSFTLANQTTDGTNLKLTVDPDTDATMSIAWVISYRTLE
jgi:hypothetical protein